MKHCDVSGMVDLHAVGYLTDFAQSSVSVGHHCSPVRCAFLSPPYGTSGGVMAPTCPTALPGSARGRDTGGTVPEAATRRHLRPTATVSHDAAAAHCCVRQSATRNGSPPVTVRQ